MQIEFIVEERSAAAFLAGILPRLLRPSVTARIHPHRGKHDLLAKLPARLRAYAEFLPADWRIVVLVDEDREDCRELKATLEDAARRAGMGTQTSPRPADGRVQVVNRIAVEELEAWFFGDMDAVRAAYPRVSRTIERHRRYRETDSIVGGTWEALERVLQTAGYYRTGLPKIEVAQRIARHMDPDRNRSRSFQCFWRALTTIVRGEE